LGPRAGLGARGLPLQVARFDLEVALFGVVVLAGGGGGAQARALAFDGMASFVGDDVIGEDSREPASPTRATLGERR